MVAYAARCLYLNESLGQANAALVENAQHYLDHPKDINDRDSFHMARRLIKEEGLLVGGSSGTAMWATLEALKAHPEVKKVLTILPDSIRNYLTKFVNDAWMKDHGFLEEDSVQSAEHESKVEA